MEYTLGLLETIKIAFIKGDDFSTFKYITWFFMLPVVVFLISKYKINTQHKYKLVMVTLIIMSVADWPIYKSGWKIDGTTLYVKAYFYSAEISIPKMKICFIDENSEWWITGNNRTGIDYPKLSVGKYSLKNRKKALLFNYCRQRELILVAYNNYYYLIGYPGINSLHKELINLGAKESTFSDYEVKR